MTPASPATLGVAAALSCACTLALCLLGVPSVVASAATTLVFSRLLPDRAGVAAAAFTGSFAGMTGIETPSAVQVGIASTALCAAVATVFLLAGSRRYNPWWNLGRGVGGRLGTLAFIASLPIGLVVARHAPPAPVWLPAMALVGGLGAVVPSLFPTRRIVQRTAVVGLLGGVVLLAFPLVAGAWYAGCFVSMSDDDVASGAWGRLIAGVGAGVVYACLTTALPAIGGSMGLAALVAVVLADRTLTSLRTAAEPA